jgi:phage replication O-like protein O
MTETSTKNSPGFTQVPNDVLDAFIKTRIPGEARQVLDFFIRKTLGYNKLWDKTALSQINLATGIVKPSIVRAIRMLESMNLIYKKANGNITEYCFNRDFTTWKPLTKKLTVSKNVNDHLRKSKSPLAKKLTSVSEKATHKRNIKETITKDNIQKKDVPPYKDIIIHLNLQTGKTFSAETKATQSHINARWKEGFTLDDFKTVIDNKCTSWLHDHKMSIYLRPETLFSSKFESYLNEVQSPLIGKVSDTTLRNIPVLEGWRPPA